MTQHSAPRWLREFGSRVRGKGGRCARGIRPSTKGENRVRARAQQTIRRAGRGRPVYPSEAKGSIRPSVGKGMSFSSLNTDRYRVRSRGMVTSSGVRLKCFFFHATFRAPGGRDPNSEHHWSQHTQLGWRPSARWGGPPQTSLGELGRRGVWTGCSKATGRHKERTLAERACPGPTT